MCALCAAIICVLSPLSIPIGPVPISLATFAVMLSAAILGAKWGTIATIVYILLGAVGVPVFAGWTGGVGIIAGQTGGYIIGYIPLAFLTGFFYDRFGRHKAGKMKYAWLMIGMILGTAVLYLIGTAWFIAVSGAALADAMGWCVLPFLPGDFIKMIIVTIAAPKISEALDHAGVRTGSESA
jgi:biotin transport system substrate-specific component